MYTGNVVVRSAMPCERETEIVQVVEFTPKAFKVSFCVFTF